MDISKYKVDAKKFRRITEHSNDMYAETVTSCVERFLGLGEPNLDVPGGVKVQYPPTQHIIDFLLDAGILVEKDDASKLNS